MDTGYVLNGMSDIHTRSGKKKFVFTGGLAVAGLTGTANEINRMQIQKKNLLCG